MAEKAINPINPTDDEARALARQLMNEAVTASLGVIEPETGMPLVSRVAVMIGADGSPLVLASRLSAHCQALLVDARASLLMGDVGQKGDPLTHPRITVIGRMQELPHDDTGHEERRANWLKRYPKAKLYIDFGDFHFYRMAVERANLNGGFGKAFHLSAQDVGIAPAG